MNGRIILAVLLAVILIAGMVGAGIYVYNVGVAQGLADSGKLAAPTTGVAPYPYAGGPFFYHRPFGFGLLGCAFPLLFLFLFFALLRTILWRGPWGWRHGMHHGVWEKGVPSMFEEWHRKMHEPQSGDSSRV
jgi:hypothetical protein